MGRKKLWVEEMQARFLAGTFMRISQVLAAEEDRTDFVREAVEKELSYREKKRLAADSQHQRRTSRPQAD
jgi:hypothetical protein